MSNVALITGANRGIGLEVARQLGRRGTLVLLGVRDTTKGEAAADKLRAQGIDAEVLAIDTTSEAAVAAAADETANRHERLDILVNNAAIMPEYAQGILTPSQLPPNNQHHRARATAPTVDARTELRGLRCMH